MPYMPTHLQPAKDHLGPQKAAPGRRGRRKGVSIKPGTVKQARLEAGLSLGQVARDDISRTAIYFVETGKAKPSMETLTLIAQRTGRPIEFFLEPAPAAERPVSTAEVERLVAVGDNAGAVLAGEAILPRVKSPETEAHLNFLLSTAHLRLAHPVVGRRLAVEARAYFERRGDLAMVAECLGNEASAAYLVDDPAAVSIVEGALSTVRTMQPVPRQLEYRLLAILGHAHLAKQDYARAIAAYHDAVEAADVVQDLYKTSLLYAGMSSAYSELGQFAQAGHYARRALTIHETLNDRLSLARSENSLGLLLLHGGDAGAALPHLERSLLLFDEVGVETGKAHVLLSLAELALARHDLSKATNFAEAGLALAEKLGERATAGEAHIWLANIARASGDEAAVDAEFSMAIEALEEQGGAWLARCHALYADVLESRGDLAGANAHLRRALRQARPAAVAEPAARTATA